MRLKTLLEWINGERVLRPQVQPGPFLTLMSLEPRLMFDGAAATTADPALVAERPASTADRTSAPASGQSSSPTSGPGKSAPDARGPSGADKPQNRQGADAVTPKTFNPPQPQPDANKLCSTDTDPVHGNVITGGSAGDRADSDPDKTDVRVQGVRAGSDMSNDAVGSVNKPVAGRYGTIVIGADGRYTYTLDPNNPAVQGLQPGQLLTDTFVYTLVDPTGLTASTTVTITIDGGSIPTQAGDVFQTIDRPDPAAAPSAVSVTPPTVVDPDTPTENLTVRIEGIERPDGGSFLRPDGRPVQAGDTLTVAELQRLRFVPRPGFVGTPNADGTTPTSSLLYTVNDDSCGSTKARIDIVLRAKSGPPDGETPTTTVVIPPGPSVVGGVREDAPGFVRPEPFPPFGNGPGVQFSVPGDASVGMPPAVASTVAQLRTDTIDGREELDTASRVTDLDAGGLLPSSRIAGFFGEEVIGPLRGQKALDGQRPNAASSMSATAPGPLGVAGTRSPADVPPGPKPPADEDCKPEVVVKPRPKPVKRILPDGVAKPSTSFTEQIDVQKKRFKLPPKVAPKPPLSRQC